MLKAPRYNRLSDFIAIVMHSDEKKLYENHFFMPQVERRDLDAVVMTAEPFAIKFEGISMET